MAQKIVVFVHGWSVTNTDTYGGLPQRLASVGLPNGDTIALHDIRLSRYVSFRDEVRMPDLVRGLESALRTELADLIASGERFALITHSTGGPLAREWWYRYYASKGAAAECPMSHLVMLAPANFGSALAQLGKSRISELKSWMEGVEPGQGILDWLELGSSEAWTLNERWIRGQFKQNPAKPVFPFVLTGQSIDRSIYDYVNSYTGELGSDGVVRVAAANLNASMLRLRQEPLAKSSDEKSSPLTVSPKTIARAPATAFRLISGASHSGQKMGIMRSVSPQGSKLSEVVEAIRSALTVNSSADYDTVCKQFETESRAVFDAERCELEKIILLPDRKYIHDAMSMMIFRVTDTDGRPVTDFKLMLTGLNNDPNLLPSGFFRDRQANSKARNTVTYYINNALLTGSDTVATSNGSVWREAESGINELGIMVEAKPSDGFAHYVPAQFVAKKNEFLQALNPHETTMIDIVLQRVVHAGAVQLQRGDEARGSFKKQEEGAVIPELEQE